jgi:hypothetical protein
MQCVNSSKMEILAVCKLVPKLIIWGLVWNEVIDDVWTSLGPLPQWVLGPTTRWAPGTTRLGLHGTCWREAQGFRWRSTRIGSCACPVPCRELLDVHD